MPGDTVGEAANDADQNWAAAVQAFRRGTALTQPAWDSIFGPLRRGTVDNLLVIGQCGQSIDGRIATTSRHSKYINGPAGLQHLHRLRSLVDAVVIGVGTALQDDPQLTVRRVAGPSPARVVIDPNSRLPATAQVLAANGVRRVVIRAQGADGSSVPDVECVTLPVADGQIAPADILGALSQRGFRRILIEGMHDLGGEILLDCDLTAQRVVVGAAKISM